MKVSYYPGCTLRTKAKELDRYARDCALALGFELCEPDDWQCCGGAFTSASDEIATKLSSVRALKGVTPEELAKTRHELLATKPADLAAMAGVLRKYAREGKFCTFSGANGGA